MRGSKVFSFPYTITIHIRPTSKTHVITNYFMDLFYKNTSAKPSITIFLY